MVTGSRRQRDWPVLKQSGKVRYLQRATAGDKALKRVFYQTAFIIPLKFLSRSAADTRVRQVAHQRHASAHQ